MATIGSFKKVGNDFQGEISPSVCRPKASASSGNPTASKTSALEHRNPRDDADAFGLKTEGDESRPGNRCDLLERTDGSHVTSPVCVSSPRPTAASMAIFRPRTIGDAPALRAQRSGGRRSLGDFLAREEWA